MTSRRQISTAALFLIMGVLSAIQMGKIAPLIPVLREHLELDLVLAGWLASLISLIAAVGGYALGFASDRIGRSRTLRLGLMAFAAGNVIGALATTPLFLFLGRLVEGFGYISLMVTIPSLIFQTTPRHLHRIFLGLWGAVIPVGIMIMMLIANAVHQHAGWQAIWWISAILFATFLLLISTGPYRLTDDAAPSRPAFSVRFPIGIWILAICFASYTMQWLSLVTWLPSFYHSGASSFATDKALVTTLVVGANILGNLLGTALLYRGVSSRILIATGAIAMASACFIVFAIMPSTGWLGVSAFTGSLLGGLIPPSVISEIPAHMGGKEGLSAANGIIMQGSSVGSLLGPPMAAALFTPQYSWSIAGSVLATLSVISLAMILMLKQSD